MDKKAYKNFWVHIEHSEGKIHSVSLELCCEMRKLCDLSGDKLIAVVVGKLPAQETKKLLDCGADGILQVSGSGYERYNTEAYTNLYYVLCRKYHPSAVMIGGTVNGRDFAPRFAARLGVGCTSDATELIYNAGTGDIEFVEPAAGGKIMAVITMPVMRPQIGTIRPGTFKYAPAGKKEQTELLHENIDFDPSLIRTERIDFTPELFDPALDIAETDCLVCIGAGVKEESLPKYRELASLLGGKLGCTRPVADSGLLPYKLQVGQSGVMIKTKLYIGFGVSGAVNHVTGVSADKFIAINRDASAAIFNYCDYGIIGDADEICDAMLASLKT